MNYFQISTSALATLTGALKSAPTQSDPMCVVVDRDILWLVTHTRVKVCVKVTIIVLQVYDTQHNLFKDINECNDGINRCEHSCSNTIGSYNCSCLPGYMLNASTSYPQTCDGTAN